MFDSIQEAVAANPRVLILGDPSLSHTSVTDEDLDALHNYAKSSGVILVNLNTNVNDNEDTPQRLLHLFMPQGESISNYSYLIQHSFLKSFVFGQISWTESTSEAHSHKRDAGLE